MRCPECAADIPDDSQFCPSCGGQVPAQAPPPPAPAPAPAPSPEKDDSPFAARGKNQPQPSGDSAPEAPAKASGHGEKAFCEVCLGSFPAKDIETMDGKKACSGCRKRMEERKDTRKPSSRRAARPPGEAPGPPAAGGPPPPPEGEKPIVAPQKSIRITEPLSGSRMAAFAAGGVFIVLILVVGVAFFLFGGDGGKAPKTSPVVQPDPASAKADPVVKHDPTPAPPVKKAEPAPPPKPRSYESRWFNGSFRGSEPAEDPAGSALIFESDSKEKVLIVAPKEVAEHFEKGKRYKFKFEPTDEFYNTGTIKFFELEATIQEDK